MEASELTERDYADLGRALVEKATESATAKIRGGMRVEKGKAVQLNGLMIRVRFEETEAASSDELHPDSRPVRCCICILYEDMVICYGPCCEPPG
jgi:hypothetical protein